MTDLVCNGDGDIMLISSGRSHLDWDIRSSSSVVGFTAKSPQHTW
jgi:hypothetical protein